MTHDICHCLERSLVLVTGSDLVAVRLGTVFLVGEQDRDLGTQLRELKRAYAEVSLVEAQRDEAMQSLHAINVIHEPAVAPAAPKQATEAKLGYVPLALTWASTSIPKYLCSQFE